MFLDGESTYSNSSDCTFFANTANSKTNFLRYIPKFDINYGFSYIYIFMTCQKFHKVVIL
jgi:hypothetical protein